MFINFPQNNENAYRMICSESMTIKVEEINFFLHNYHKLNENYSKEYIIIHKIK